MTFRAALIGVLAVAACGDDDANGSGEDHGHTGPRDFALRIENIAPWTVLKAGTQATRTDMTDGSIAPSQAFEIRFTAGNNHFVSFAAMLGESNDWFFAPGPAGIPLYTEGAPTSGDVTQHVRLWDAGTELDQEPAVGAATGPRQPTRNFGESDPDPRVREVSTTTVLGDGSTFVLPPIDQMIRVTLTPALDRQFVLRIENVSTPTSLQTSQGPLPVHISPLSWAVHRMMAPLFEVDMPAPETGLELLAEAGAPDALGESLRNVRGIATPLSPGVVVVHTLPAPLFTLASPDRGAGLERLAEDGNHLPLLESLQASTPDGVSAIGAFESAMPGEAFEITVRGTPGDAVSFATMFGASNDWFFATRPEGIALFHDESPRSCDVTADVLLYDLGTEADEELDVGPNTAPQQPAPDTGRSDRLREVREVTLQRYGVPEVLHLRVTLTPL